MKQEINLEAILESVQLEDGAMIRSYLSRESNIYKIIREAMKEACYQCLDLAVKNAKCTMFEEVDPNSILQIKDWIK